MKCPSDSAALRRQNYESTIDVDMCPTCGGMWLDQGELERVQATVERNYSGELSRFPDLIGAAQTMAFAKSRPLVACPGCQREMERREHGYCSLILIDVCPSCRGVWLDAGEMRALEVFFERARAETASVRRGFLATLRDLIIA
jgi:Zn-finger nucleic acid-binding protein